MSKADRTRQQILEVIAPIFNKKGYKGTALSDLCAATGLTKGALYGNFRDKEDLSLQAFQHAVRKVKGQAREKVDLARTNKHKLLALLDFYAQYVLAPPVAGGCPLLNTAIEADDAHETLKVAVAEELEQTVSFMASLIEKGKKTGEFKKNVNARESAFMFFCAIEGALMFSRVSPSDEAMRWVVKKCRKMLNEMSTKSE